MNNLLDMIAEIDDYRAFCAQWGIPVQLDTKAWLTLQEIESLAKEYIRIHATSNEVASTCIDEVPF